jgi:hypothetical protein
MFDDVRIFRVIAEYAGQNCFLRVVPTQEKAARLYAWRLSGT